MSNKRARRKETESLREKVVLFEKMMSGKASALELMKLSFLRGMITKEQYEDCAENEEKNEDEGKLVSPHK